MNKKQFYQLFKKTPKKRVKKAWKIAKKIRKRGPGKFVFRYCTEYEKLALRYEAAEAGVELTPDEVDVLIELIVLIQQT